MDTVIVSQGSTFSYHKRFELLRRQFIIQKSKRCFADYMNTNLASCRTCIMNKRVSLSRLWNMVGKFAIDHMVCVLPHCVGIVVPLEVDRSHLQR
jgi:hypothetical protein